MALLLDSCVGSGALFGAKAAFRSLRRAAKTSVVHFRSQNLASRKPPCVEDLLDGDDGPHLARPTFQTLLLCIDSRELSRWPADAPHNSSRASPDHPADESAVSSPFGGFLRRAPGPVWPIASPTISLSGDDRIGAASCDHDRRGRWIYLERSLGPPSCARLHELYRCPWSPTRS